MQQVDKEGNHHKRSQPPAHPAHSKVRDLLKESHLLIKQLWALFP